MIFETLNNDGLLQKIYQETIPDEIMRKFNLAKLVIDKPNEFTEEQLADKMNVSVTTIRRDCCKLRTLGIIIHSRRRYFECYNIINIPSENGGGYRISISNEI